MAINYADHLIYYDKIWIGSSFKHLHISRNNFHNRRPLHALAFVHAFFFIGTSNFYLENRSQNSPKSQPSGAYKKACIMGFYRGTDEIHGPRLSPDLSSGLKYLGKLNYR